MLQYLITALQKLAATRNIAIVILSQCITKMRPGSGAGPVLVPAVSTSAWEQGLGCRIALFRDWIPGGGNSHNGNGDRGGAVRAVSLARVLKAGGRHISEGAATVVAFEVEKVSVPLD